MRAIFALFLILSATAYGQDSAKPRIPKSGAYVGLSIDAQQPSLSDLNLKTGVEHSLFMEFFRFPDVVTNPGETDRLVKFIASAKEVGAIPVLTIETFGGLQSYSVSDVRALGRILKASKSAAFLRWNHEMNGSWYPWGQQPTLYVKKFREFQSNISRIAPRVAFVWAPNQGWGAPWANREFSVLPGSADFERLDTNRDGILSSSDDPYLPYYPGSKFVDWVGISFYHWGNQPTEGFNEVPLPGKWAYANGIGGSVVNFHNSIAKKFRKPMMIAETAAFFAPTNLKGGGASEDSIKMEWIDQVYNVSNASYPSLTKTFPLMKALLWFNDVKYESDVDEDVDWSVSSNPTVASHYAQRVGNAYFIKAKP